MVYPWSKKPKPEEEPNSNDEKNEVSELPEADKKATSKEVKEEEALNKEENLEDISEIWDNEDPRSIILNILKLEGYKMDSGELFVAFKEASRNDSEQGMMEDFKKSLEELSKLGKIKSDSDGNIMTVENFVREKSQAKTDEDVGEETEIEEKEDVDEETEIEEKEDVDEETESTEIEEKEDVDEETKKEEKDSDDLDSIIKLKEETDSWLIEKIKNSSSSENNDELKKEVEELKIRVTKLENVIKNLTKAFE